MLYEDQIESFPNSISSYSWSEIAATSIPGCPSSYHDLVLPRTIQTMSPTSLPSCLLSSLYRKSLASPRWLPYCPSENHCYFPGFSLPFLSPSHGRPISFEKRSQWFLNSLNSVTHYLCHNLGTWFNIV